MWLRTPQEFSPATSCSNTAKWFTVQSLLDYATRNSRVHISIHPFPTSRFLSYLFISQLSVHIFSAGGIPSSIRWNMTWMQTISRTDSNSSPVKSLLNQVFLLRYRKNSTFLNELEQMTYRNLKNSWILHRTPTRFSGLRNSPNIL